MQFILPPIKVGKWERNDCFAMLKYLPPFFSYCISSQTNTWPSTSVCQLSRRKMQCVSTWVRWSHNFLIDDDGRVIENFTDFFRCVRQRGVVVLHLPLLQAQVKWRQCGCRRQGKHALFMYPFTHDAGSRDHLEEQRNASIVRLFRISESNCNSRRSFCNAVTFFRKLFRSNSSWRGKKRDREPRIFPH